MYKYLFRDDHNGYEATYHPFEVEKSLSQNEANQLILSIAPAANRTGSCLGHLLEALDKKNIKFKEYKSVYHKPEENEFRTVNDKNHHNTDPLPECMYFWPIIKNISGNY